MAAVTVRLPAQPVRRNACTLIICARFCSQEEPEEKENTANGDVAAERDVVPRRLGLSARDDSTRGAPGRPPSAHPVRPLPTQPALGRACHRLAATTRFRALTSPACFPCADEAGSKRASEGDAPIGETKRVKRDQVAEIIAAADTANAAAAEAAISELKTSEPPAAEAPPDFGKKRVPELRKELVALGLNDKGRKDELVERLTNHFLEQQAAAAAAAAAARPRFALTSALRSEVTKRTTSFTRRRPHTYIVVGGAPQESGIVGTWLTSDDDPGIFKGTKRGDAISREPARRTGRRPGHRVAAGTGPEKRGTT